MLNNRVSAPLCNRFKYSNVCLRLGRPYVYMYVMWNTYIVHEHIYIFMSVMLGKNELQENNDVGIGIIRPPHCQLQYRFNIS